MHQEVNTQWRSWRKRRRMKGTTTPKPPNSIRHHSLLWIEVVQASEKGNIDTYHALSGDRDMPSKVTLNSYNQVLKKLNKIIILIIIKIIINTM